MFHHFLFNDAAVAKMKLKHLDTVRKRIRGSGFLDEYRSSKEAKLQNNKSQTLPAVSQSATNHDNFEYVSVISAGSQKTSFRVILDTGSSTLWLSGSDCFTPSCGHKHKFDSRASSSFTPISGTLNMLYGDGSYATGYFGNDTIWLGDDGGHLEISMQSFGIATNLSSRLGGREIDGLLGLGFTELDGNDHDPPLINAMNNGKLDMPIFTVWLAGDSGTDGGQFTYGGLDSEHCGEVIGYEPLTHAAYWEFEIQSFGVDGWKSKKGKAISDTGTTMIYGPQGVIESIVHKFDAIPVHTSNDEILYYVTCSEAKSDLVVEIGANKYTISRENYLFRDGGDACVLALGAMDTFGFGASYILGDVFIRQYCQIHDMAQQRIGFAPSLPATGHSIRNRSQFTAAIGLLIPMLLIILKPTSIH